MRRPGASIQRVGLAGGAPTTFVTGLGGTSLLTLDATTLYFLEILRFAR